MAKQTFTTGQVLTAAQVNSLQANDFNQTVSAKTASYVLVASDKGTRIEFNTSGSVTCTVNTGLFDAGDTVYIQNRGAGVVTITAGTATVNTSASLALNQWEGGLLYFISASAAVWYEYASTANGDITGITTGATSGLTGGVTSGTADLKLNVTAKGDLLVGTGSGAVSALAVATEGGSTLVADSSTSTGLRYQPTLLAGRNFLINGGFDIWQRGTSFVGAGTGVYLADRWVVQNAGTTPTYSRQSTGAPNGSQYVLRIASSASGTYANIAQLIETANVQLLWGSTATFSVKVRKNASYTRDIELYIQKSATVDAALGATWSTIATKTISNASLPTGTGVTDWFSDYISGVIPNDGTANSIRVVVAQANTATGSGQYWEVGNCQLEIGSVPTQFSRAGGTLAGELVAAQRYYYRTSGTNAYQVLASGASVSTTSAVAIWHTPTMRIASTDVTNGNLYWEQYTGVAATNPTVTVQNASRNAIRLNLGNMTGLTASQFGLLYTNNDANSFIAVNAEL